MLFPNREAKQRKTMKKLRTTDFHFALTKLAQAMYFFSNGSEHVQFDF